MCLGLVPYLVHQLYVLLRSGVDDWSVVHWSMHMHFLELLFYKAKVGILRRRHAKSYALGSTPEGRLRVDVRQTTGTLCSSDRRFPGSFQGVHSPVTAV